MAVDIAFPVLGGRRRYRPVVDSVGFIQAPIAETVAALDTWAKEIGALKGVGAPIVTNPGRGIESLEAIAPVTLNDSRRKLLIQTVNPEWTAFFSSDRQGADSGHTAFMAGRLNTRAVYVSCHPHTVPTEPRTPNSPAGWQASVGLTVYSKAEAEPGSWFDVVRDIQLHRDSSRWRLHQSGAVQPFERPEEYNNRKVADRFPPELLDEYCQAMGLRVFDSEFFNGPALLVTSPPTFQTTWSVSFEEAHKYYGIAAD